MGCSPDSEAAGQTRESRAREEGSVANPFGTSFLLPWVSHFVQHSDPKEAWEALFTTQQIKPPGEASEKIRRILVSEHFGAKV